MKRIFNKEKMWENMKDILEKEDGIKTIEEMIDDSPWIIKCDGHEVKQFKETSHYLVELEGRPLPYIIHKNWTVEVDDDFDNDFKTIIKESKRVFNTDKWYETTGKHFAKLYGIKNKKDLLELCEWCNKCEGREPINGMIDSFKIADDWCVDINEYKRFEI